MYSDRATSNLKARDNHSHSLVNLARFQVQDFGSTGQERAWTWLDEIPL